MTTQFNVLTQKNLYEPHLAPDVANIVNVSKLHQASNELRFRGFSIRIVQDGQETYTVNGTTYQVNAGQYLLTQPQSRGAGLIDSRKAVSGMCIDLLPSIMAQVADSWLKPEQPDAQHNPFDLLKSGELKAHRFQVSETKLGQLLAQMGQILAQQPDPKLISQSLIYALSEGYLFDYQHILKQIKSINSIKTSTRQELHRRVSVGRDYIDAHFREALDIAEVAQVAQISEYHFFRLFKAVYGVSPHQFILQKRLNFGKNLLQSGHCAVTDAALASGFSDIYSFSKAFKKQFGVAPSECKYRISNR
ncbi:MAG: AraC family transcriptional regulator [Bacteroidota bacterium]